MNPETENLYWRLRKEEAPVWLCEVSKEPVTYAACLACARAVQQPECPFPPHLIAALHAANQPDDVVESIRHTGYPVIRVSSLLGCKLKSWLGRREGFPLETPRDHWARLRGTLIHKAIEEMGMDAQGLTEKRLSAFVWDDQVAAFVTGRVDAYDMESRTLFDFKTINVGRGGLSGMTLPRPRHVKQLQLYAWLLARNGYPPPKQIRIVYMTMADLRTEVAPAPDEAELDQIHQRVLITLQEILSDQAPPEKPPEAWECKFCHFSKCSKSQKSKRE